MYTYVTPISILKKLTVKERQKFFRPSLFSDDKTFYIRFCENDNSHDKTIAMDYKIGK